MGYKQLKLWFDEELAVLLADKFLEKNIPIDKSSFVNNVSKLVTSLELKDRVECIADELRNHLGETHEKNIMNFIEILGPENEEETGMFKKFYWIMPLAKYVEKYGLNHFDISMKAIYEITKRNTGEYTIRPFLDMHFKETLSILLKWSKDSNRYVRRLASEGVRPRLPWASKLDKFINDPTPIFPILDNLKDDKSKYVQKSVANCLNDILKDNPEPGKRLIDSWLKEISAERKWIIRHALRNLIKSNDKWAMGLISLH